MSNKHLPLRSVWILAITLSVVLLATGALAAQFATDLIQKTPMGEFSGSPTIVWISNKLDYPIKIESTTLQGNVVMIYKNIKEKRYQAQSFQLPSDYEKITMPMMMPGMSNQ